VVASDGLHEVTPVPRRGRREEGERKRRGGREEEERKRR
jgi:hypothetical protein